MCVSVASFCPLVPDDPPQWHVYLTHVSEGQRSLSLLEHRYLRPKMLEHEMFTYPPRTVAHYRSTQYQAPHQLEYPGEGHHVCGRSIHLIIDSSRLGDADSMLDQNVLFEGRLCYRHFALSATYLQPILLPKRGSFTCFPSLVRLLPPLPPD